MNLDADNVFYETKELGRVCLGGAPFSHALLCTRMGGFEIWRNMINGGGECIAGEGYAPASKIEIEGVVVFERAEDFIEEKETP